MSRMGGVVAALLGGILTAGPHAVAQPQGQPQKMEPPKWLDDTGKDLFNDLETEDLNTFYGAAACETREKLLKAMAGKGDRDAADHRSRVLLGLSLCEMKKGDWVKSKKRWENTLSEFNAPSEDAMLQNPNFAPFALMKQAADLMAKHEVSQAGTALRRCREIMDRNLKKMLKMIQKQMGAQAPPAQKLIEELPGYGKTGQFLPMIVKQVPILKQDLPWAEMIEDALDSIDGKVATFDVSQKQKKDRLGVSRGASKEGSSLMYVRVLITDATAPANQLALAQELGDMFKELKEEAGSVEKSVALLKRTKAGPGCDGGSMPKTCESLQKMADVQSNGFGETRLLVLKAGKKQALEACSTNANVGILLATADGAQVTVAGAQEPVALSAGEPLVVDFCQQTSIAASAATKVLFVQAWHPEFAAVERTTELRARAKTFGLAEAEVKAAAETVNKHAKKNWDKVAKQWRKVSETNKKVKEGFEGEKAAKLKMEEEAAEAKRKEEEGGDEERKKGLEELERKREAKRKQAEAEEQKRLRQRKLMEEERLKRDPWLNAPTVRAIEQQLAGMKQERRDANAKLEFDLSTQLTKDISAAERALKKAIKKARKAFKKGGAAALEELAAGTAGKNEEAAEDKAKGNEEELAALKEKLEAITKEKAAAAEAENFKEAKRLKAEQEELKKKISKLEL